MFRLVSNLSFMSFVSLFFFGFFRSFSAFFGLSLGGLHVLDDLNAIVGFIFNTLNSVFGLYLAGGVLSGVLGIWLLRRVSRLFDKLR
jgi:hypothetical protein